MHTLQGDTGDAGPPGPAGAHGSQGLAGPHGQKGIQGPRGPKVRKSSALENLSLTGSCMIYTLDHIYQTRTIWTVF